MQPHDQQAVCDVMAEAVSVMNDNDIYHWFVDCPCRLILLSIFTFCRYATLISAQIMFSVRFIQSSCVLCNMRYSAEYAFDFLGSKQCRLANGSD
jgi:hypothetical protein